MPNEEEQKKVVEDFNKLRAACLKNATELLRASLLALNEHIDHVSFHLSVLALEEMGKIEIGFFKAMSLQNPDGGNEKMSFKTDDHQRKLFHAIWTTSFGRNMMTKDSFASQQNLAKILHRSRMDYLYVEPDNILNWEEKMEQGEAKKLYDFVDIHLKYAQEVRGEMIDKIPPEELAELRWFWKINEDPTRRAEVWSFKSQEKLIELGDSKKWIKWLKEVYDQNDAEVTALLQAELSRKTPSDEVEAKKPKWRVKIHVVTPSHSLRKKTFTDFNKNSDHIKIQVIDSNNLTLELNLPKSLPLERLWDTGWGISRTFIAAMNIATHGLFWWNVKTDPARYYKEMKDLETRVDVIIEMNPRLEIGWKEQHWVFGETELVVTLMVFDYLMKEWRPGADNHFQDYVTALSIFAKNDIHLRAENSAFVHFFGALKRALIENGAWDEKSDFTDAYQKQVEYQFPKRTTKMEEHLKLGFELDKTHKSSQSITITEVVAMKTYYESYVLRLAKEHKEKVMGTEIRFEMGKNDADVKPEPIP